MQKRVIQMMIITIAIKVIGFSREILMSYFYGTSIVKDAYVVAVTIPMTLVGFITIGITSTFIPIYNKVKEESPGEENRFMNNLLNIFLLCLSIILILSLIFTPAIVKVFAFGYAGEQQILAVKFTRIMLLIIYTGVISGIFKGFLNIYDNFIAPLVGALALNILLVLTIFVASKFGTIYLVIGSVVAYYFQYVFYIPYLRKFGYRYKPVLDVKSSDIHDLIYLSIPIVIGTAVMDISNIIDKSMASSLVKVGGVSALDYSFKLVMMVTGIVIVTFATYIYPKLSILGNNRKLKEIKELALSTISSMYILVVPISLLMYVYSEDIVSILFKRGEFDDDSVLLVSGVFKFYVLYLFGQVIVEIINRCFYSLGNSKLPAKVSVIMILVGIVLNVILASLIGIRGLSLATAITTNVNAFALVYIFIRDYGAFDYAEDLKKIGKIFLASILMVVVSKVIYNVLDANYLIFILIMCGAMAFYFAELVIMKVICYNELKKLIFRRK